MTLSVDDIKTAVTDKLTTEVIDDVRLDRLIAAAVRFYSRFNPVIKSAVLDAMAAQQDYDTEVDCVLVTDVTWWPNGEPVTTVNVGQEYLNTLLFQGRAPDRADYVVRNEKVILRDDMTKAHWQQIGKKIRLWPIPTADHTSIPYEYTAMHVLDEYGEAYGTVPNEDLEIMRDLTLAEYLEGRATEAALEPDYAEGMQSTKKSFIPQNIASQIARLTSELIAKYGSTPCQM